jgi:U3 small nucleolar RNA-associated protein 15
LYILTPLFVLQVQVYNPVTKVVTKNLNKFKEAAYGATFRADGHLLCAGGEESVVRLFEVNTKSMLRQFRGHKA